MYLTIDTIHSAHINGLTSTASAREVTVTCAHPYRLEGRAFQVDITAASVTVREVDPGDHDAMPQQPHYDLARVLVAPDLIDATRRLFGLVG